MKRKYEVVLCVIIIICIAVGVYCDLNQSQKGLDYQIPFVEKLNKFVLSPIMWVCVGILVSSVISIRKSVPNAFRAVMTILSLVSILVYACAAVLLVSKQNMEWVYKFVGWCTLHSSVFAVPGLVGGVAIKCQE